MGDRPSALSELVRAWALVVGVAVLASGCASFEVPSFPGSVQNLGVTSRCESILAAFERAVDDAGVRDAEARVVPGFSYLRVNRFLAHIGSTFEGRAYGAAFTAWVDRLQGLATEARRIEVANLPKGSFVALSQSVAERRADREGVLAVTENCAKQLRRQQLADASQRRALVANAKVADDYNDIARAIGLFPLTSIAVEAGWQKWKETNLDDFNRPLDAIRVEGQLVDFVPKGRAKTLSPARVRRILERARDPHLGIPEPQGNELRELLLAFAPIWQIDVGGNYDVPGSPALGPERNSVQVNIQQPTVFTRVSHAVINGRVLLQLNYSIWFLERPSSGPLDSLAGKLDGLIWRVTLGQDGRPLVFDSIHACGCYHFVFLAGAGAQPRQAGRGPAIREVPAILTAPKIQPGERIVLRLASGSHYLTGITSSGKGAKGARTRSYHLVSDQVLRSLPLPGGGRRSLYGEDGLVAGSERLERFLLWPTGVDSPGAMRQWGRHATALTDRRHFDDPQMLAQVLGW